jgi:hypothetical protein
MDRERAGHGSLEGHVSVSERDGRTETCTTDTCGTWSVAGAAVDRLAQKVHLAEMAGVLLDEVDEDPA